MDDFYLNFISALNISDVNYMVVGGFAVNFYGYNRTTADLDIWISTTGKNLICLEKALYQLGFEFSNEAELELKNNNIISLAEGNCIVELIPRLKISQEVGFEEAYQMSETRKVEDVEINVISLERLKNEKARSKRYKDLDDLSKLEEAEAYYAKKSTQKKGGS